MECYLYNLVEIFYSKQGEGYNFGKDVVFIRFSYCNLNCYWCDTDWKKTNLYMNYKAIKEFLDKHNCKNVIITGGEPTYEKNYDKFYDLTKNLLNDNINVHIETNGLVDIKNKDPLFKKIWVSTSPKIIYKSLYEKKGIISEADEVRIVIDPKLNIDKQIEAINWFRSKIKTKRWYLSPCEVDMKFDFNKLAIIYDKLNSNLKENELAFNISIQLHKLMGIE